MLKSTCISENMLTSTVGMQVWTCAKIMILGLAMSSKAGIMQAGSG